MSLFILQDQDPANVIDAQVSWGTKLLADERERLVRRKRSHPRWCVANNFIWLVLGSAETRLILPSLAVMSSGSSSYTNKNPPLGGNPNLARTGLSVQELKHLTAIRMSQTQDSKSRPTKEVLGHPPRNPAHQQPRPQAAPVYHSPQLEPKAKTRIDNQHSKSTKNKGRGRASPVDTSFGSMPHGLTVQELKELTRIRLAREAVTAYSPETSDYSDARTHTTSATFRSGYTLGDLDSYSDSGSVHRNRSTSTSPISNTDSDSFDDNTLRYPYHPPGALSPSSLNRPERDRQVPYSPENVMMSMKSPHTSPNHFAFSQSHVPLANTAPQKSYQGIHPGLHQKSSPQAIVPDYQMTKQSIPSPRIDQLCESTVPAPTLQPRSFSIEREPTSSATGGNSLRKFALTNTVNSLDEVIGAGSGMTPPLNPLYSFTSHPIGELSPPGSPSQRSFRGKKKLVIDCPAPVRIRSSSDCNDLAFEMAEAVLNSPGPNSPMNGSGKPIWSDPPSRRTSVCSVHSDSGIVNGILHDSNGIGLSVPPMFTSQVDELNVGSEVWKTDPSPDQTSQKSPQLSHSPVTLQSLATAFHTVPFGEHTSPPPMSQYHWK